MESPFHPMKNRMVTLYLEPYLNTYYQTYQNILTVSGRPEGPLSAMVSPISISKSFSRLSPFQEGSLLLNPNDGCILVLTRYPCHGGGASGIKQADWFLGVDDIPSVLSYLTANGYSIETELTKLLFKTPLGGGGHGHSLSGNRKMICMFQYQS